MNRRTGFLCVLVSMAAFGKGAWADDPAAAVIGSPFAGEELYDEYDDQDIAESESEWLKHPNHDLEVPQKDRRGKTGHAILVGFGESALWTTVSLRWIEWVEQNLAWSVFAGGGSFPAGNIDSRYAFVTMPRGAGGRIQWWPSANFPIAVDAEAGAFQWTVRAKCGSGMAAGECTDGKLTATGAAMSTGLLLSWLSEHRIIVEWTIVGFKYSKIFKSSWSDGDSKSDSEGEARSTISGAKVVGFANLGLGYRF